MFKITTKLRSFTSIIIFPFLITNNQAFAVFTGSIFPQILFPRFLLFSISKCCSSAIAFSFQPNYPFLTKPANITLIALYFPLLLKKSCKLPANAVFSFFIPLIYIFLVKNKMWVVVLSPTAELLSRTAVLVKPA